MIAAENVSYESVEVSDSDLEGIEQPSEPSTENKPVEANTGDESDNDDNDAPATVMVGDQEYTVDEINDAFDSHKNKTDWNKTNTEKAQKIADQRKSVEPMVQMVKMFNNNKDFTELLMDSIEDELGEEGKSLFENVLKADPGVNPYKSQLEEVQHDRDIMQADATLNKAKSELKSKFKLKDNKVNDVVDFAVKTHEETGRLISLEEAYKVLDYDTLKAKSEKNKPKPPQLANKDRGAAAIHTSDKKAGTANYDDVDISGFNLFG